MILRWALGLTLLSAVADRFGLWGQPGSANVSWGDWPHCVAYTAKVNSFLPGNVAPALAVMATAAEALLGGKPVIHSEDLATDLVWINIRSYGLADAGKLVARNRAGSPSAV